MKNNKQDLTAKIFGPAMKETIDGIRTNDPELFAMLESFVIGKIWNRPGLPLREKSLVTLSSQIAMQRWDQVKIHMLSFLHMGGTKEELREVCLHLAVYCGFPAALAALKVLRELE